MFCLVVPQLPRRRRTRTLMVARARQLGATRGGAGSFFDDNAATTLSRRSIFDMTLLALSRRNVGRGTRFLE